MIHNREVWLRRVEVHDTGVRSGGWAAGDGRRSRAGGGRRDGDITGVRAVGVKAGGAGRWRTFSSIFALPLSYGISRCQADIACCPLLFGLTLRAAMSAPWPSDAMHNAEASAAPPDVGAEGARGIPQRGGEHYTVLSRGKCSLISCEGKRDKN